MVDSNIKKDALGIETRIKLQEEAAIKKQQQMKKNDQEVKELKEIDEKTSFNVAIQGYLEQAHNNIILGKLNKDTYSVFETGYYNSRNPCPRSEEINSFDFAPYSYLLLAGSDKVSSFYKSQTTEPLNKNSESRKKLIGAAYTECMREKVIKSKNTDELAKLQKYKDSKIISKFCDDLEFLECKDKLHFPQLCEEKIFKLNCYVLDPVKYSSYQFSDDWYKDPIIGEDSRSEL